MIDALYTLSGGGTERHLYYLTKYLDKGRFQCTIVAFDMAETPLVTAIRKEGIELIHIPVKKYYSPFAFFQAIHLAKILRNRHIDIVQTFHTKSDIYGAIVARLSRIAVLISSKRDIGDLKKKVHFLLNRLINPIFDGFIAVANEVKHVTVLKEHAPESKIVTIFNGVDTQIFSPVSAADMRSMREKLGLGIGDFVVGTAAVFRPEKNYNVFLEGIRLVKDQIPGLKVIALGDGALLQPCKNWCKTRNIDNIVTFYGGVLDVSRYLKVLDVGCLLPGRNEGLSNAILEKMACGIPLIVTDVGGNSEVVVHGYNGLVIPACDARAFADALLYFYRNSSEKLRMGKNSRIRAMKEFNLERMVRDHEELYIKLYKKRKPSVDRSPG